MSNIIDRREVYKDRSSGSRQRFIKRYKKYIKDGIDKSLNSSKGITDIVGGAANKRKSVTIGRKGVDEPIFDHGDGGQHETIYSGNEEYGVGDHIPRPRSGNGSGNKGSPDGEGEDDFTFYLSRNEFIDILFEDLELPDMVKKNLLQAVVRELVHDGFTKSGAPGQLDVVRSFKNSMMRRIGLNRKPVKKEIAELEAELDELHRVGYVASSCEELWEQDVKRVEERIEALKRKLRAIPFLDEIDLRYRHKDWESKPTTSAVMFALMDVSGSMGDHEKTISKLFFFLMFLFLRQNYQQVQIVFIRHTHEAKEVDEQEFFHSRESGGTVVSTALELCYNIIKERYDPAVWNIYIAQASDGDNYDDDSAECQRLMEDCLLPIVQYMVYVQIDHEWSDLVYRHGANPEKPSNPLWTLYAKMAEQNENLAMRIIGAKPDIYPVFRKLFEKKQK